MDEVAPEISLITALESRPWQPHCEVAQQALYIDGHQSFENLFKNIFLKNQLCMLSPEATSSWASRKLWMNGDDGSPNFHYLGENFGEAVAPVADCNAQEFSAHPKQEMKVKDFITHWINFRLQDHPANAESLYLKDWHFTRSFPSYKAYSPPAFLCSDWMNEFWDVRKDEAKLDDYRFVYMGPKHSWTPFHADVLRSYSWSANICGQKKWIFYPPGTEEKLRDRHGQLVFDLRSPDLNNITMYPEASSASDAAITVIQNPGEIIFVPTGWHHQVFNLEDTISINHNWINGGSAHITWNFIKERLKAVQKEISDCKEMEGWNEQCQLILKADSGIDYVDFYNFIATIALQRIKVLKQFMAENSSLDSEDERNPHTLDEKTRQKNKGNQDNELLDDVILCEKEQCRTGNSLIYSDKPCARNSSDKGREQGQNFSQAHTAEDTTIVNPKDRQSSDQVGDLNLCESDQPECKMVSSFICSKPFSIRTSVDERSVQSQNSSNFNKDVDCGADSKCRDGGHQSHNHIKKDSPCARAQKESSCKPLCLSNACGNSNVKFLCLFKGVVVYIDNNCGHCNSKSSNNNHQDYGNQAAETDIKDNLNSTITHTGFYSSSSMCECHQCEHDLCPHWAHCGPNLALFDIFRVLDIIEDMQGQQEFKAIVENEVNFSSFCASPSDLKIQLEGIICQMKDLYYHEIFCESMKSREKHK